jgi:hypothetical protein
VLGQQPRCFITFGFTVRDDKTTGCPHDVSLISLVIWHLMQSSGVGRRHLLWIAGTNDAPLFRGLNDLEESATTPGKHLSPSHIGLMLEYTSVCKTDRYVTSLTKTCSTACGRMVSNISDGFRTHLSQFTTCLTSVGHVSMPHGSSNGLNVVPDRSFRCGGPTSSPYWSFPDVKVV